MTTSVEALSGTGGGVAAVQARIAAIQARISGGPATGFALPQTAASGILTTGDTSASASTDASSADALSSTAQAAALTDPGAALARTGSTASGGGTGAAAAALATSYLGVPYVWGGESPQGFDCSGLVQYVYGKLGVSLPRVTNDQVRCGTAVSRDQAQVGDLLFFDTDHSRAGVDHVAIYLGGGRMVQAPHTGDVVKISSVDWGTVTDIRRVAGDSTASAASTAATASATAASGSTTGASWTDRLPQAGQRYAAQIQQAASATGVDPRLLASVLWTESGFSPTAVSSTGAYGLGQLMPGTAESLGVDRTDPDQNILGCARYLAANLKRFGSARLAVAAYNAGPGAVQRAGGVPNYSETVQYVDRVLTRYRSLGGTS